MEQTLGWRTQRVLDSERRYSFCRGGWSVLFSIIVGGKITTEHGPRFLSLEESCQLLYLRAVLR